MYAYAACASKGIRQEVVVLLGLGSWVTLLRSEKLLEKLIQGEQVGVISVHGDVKDYPVARVTRSTSAGPAH